MLIVTGRTSASLRPGRVPPATRRAPPDPLPVPSARRQVTVAALVIAGMLGLVAGQIVRLGARSAGPDETVAALTTPPPVTTSRPDIVDRHGRLVATDVEVPALYVDTRRVLDRDELIERLSAVLPDLDLVALRRVLADRAHRAYPLRRPLTPRLAQAVHDLGIPGLFFRTELRRAYPSGALAMPFLGGVDADNRGTSGLERHLDAVGSVTPVARAHPSAAPPVRLSLDVGVQHALEAELGETARRLRAAAVAGIVMEAATGEIVAMASLPRNEAGRRDRVQSGAYELGSIFKVVTLAMALDTGRVTADTVIDVQPTLAVGGHEIRDLHPVGRPLTVAEILTRSSNVGSGMLALDLGPREQQLFLARAGLLSPLAIESGPVAAPLLPPTWGPVETVTISYGHGLAVAPVQMAAAAAALVNGGLTVAPTLLRRDGPPPALPRLVSAETSATIRMLLRRNVADADGTGRRADVPGLDVGGKTGTADMPGPRGYRTGAVISSFLAAFPTAAPRHVALVLVFEPKPSAETDGKVLAGLTAAPAMGRLLARLGPLLDR
jgi:cell division protein FtsI (penicillin-binding protein 3)